MFSMHNYTKYYAWKGLGSLLMIMILVVLLQPNSISIPLTIFGEIIFSLLSIWELAGVYQPSDNKDYVSLLPIWELAEVY